MPTTLLFGGSFDPVHHGHLLTALRAAELLAANRILLIPAAESPHKTGRRLAAPEHRLAMLRLATQRLPLFAVSDVELTRPAPSYTIDTLESLHAASPADSLILLIGADQLPKFHSWRRIADILRLARVAVLARPGTPLDLPATLDPSLRPHLARFTPLATPLVDISATDIRARAAAGKPLDFLLPAPVIAYMQQHHLYS